MISISPGELDFEETKHLGFGHRFVGRDGLYILLDSHKKTLQFQLKRSPRGVMKLLNKAWLQRRFLTAN
jgi:hypothetical protein